MLRIKALNEDTSEESDGEEEFPTVTKEALEQAAYAEYNSALALLKKKDLCEAKNILQNLLNCDFLSEVIKPVKGDGLSQPEQALKYACFKNLASIAEQQNDKKEALHYYLQATNLDGSDVTLWYRLGTAATEVLDYELACEAYLEGLRCNPRHWPCIEKLITMLYVLNDYIPCLLYIARAFELDPDFLKGYVFRDKILKEQPSIIQQFHLYCKGYDLGPLDTCYDHSFDDEMLEEALAMREARSKLTQELLKPKLIKISSKPNVVPSATWLSLGRKLIHLHRTMQSHCIPLRLEKASEKCDIEECEYASSKEENPTVAENDPIEQDTDQVEEEMELFDGEEDCVDTDQLLAGNSEGEDYRNRKRRRTEMAFVEAWMWGGKRRSARVRTTTRKDTEKDDMNLQEALHKLIPSSLLPSNMKEATQKEIDSLKLGDGSMDTMDLYKLFESREKAESLAENKQVSEAKLSALKTKAIEDEGYFGTDQETTDVEKFLQDYYNSDIIEVLYQYVSFLSVKWKYTWPKQLPQIYLETYQYMREHVVHPSVFDSQENKSLLMNDASMTLLYLELFLDNFLQKNPSECCSIILENQRFAESLGQAMFLSIHPDLCGEHYLTFIMRLFWVKGQIFLHQGNVDTTVDSLHTILFYLDDMNEQNEQVKVILPNCNKNNVITRDIVQKLLTTINRNQSLSEVQRLYEEQDYEQLVEILQETFNTSKPMSTTHDTTPCPDRASQLGMLMDALWQLKRYQECFYWGEACCNEAFQKYLSSEDKEQQKWASTIEKVLSGLESCIAKAGLGIVDCPRITRLVQNLIHIVCNQLEAPETSVEMPIETVTPWILLQQILQWNCKEKPKSNDSHLVDEIDPPGSIPAYINILFIAHDMLARRSWCCSNEGALLLHSMDVVIPLIHSVEMKPVRDKIVQAMEQAFYCLYALPSKKSRVRALQDHCVPQIKLTWERAIQLYQFYLPDGLPEFDSYNVPSITAEVEIVYKKIIELIPQNSDPVPLVDKMSQYIEGHIEEIPRPPVTYVPLSRQINAIYYLLGDYYFKNSDWAKAIRHYLLDVCVNPVRIDSWAGMALARGSQLETKLNSCEYLKSESEFLRHACAAQRCFRRALDIDSNHTLIWIEYGSFVYMVHSFCSRLLKQETDSLSLEMFEVLETQKEKMLDLAEEAFSQANQVWNKIGEELGLQDERWLLHYMLGKVSEKRDHLPNIYLDHYLKASSFLHLNNASYPRKISYGSPQNLSIETLEVYYRTHASILKWLEQHEGRPIEQNVVDIFNKYLQEASNGPFMAIVNKEPEMKVEEDRRKRAADSELNQAENGSRPKFYDGKMNITIMQDVINIMDDILTKVEHSLKAEDEVSFDNAPDLEKVMPAPSNSKKTAVQSEGKFKDIGNEENSDKSSSVKDTAASSSSGEFPHIDSKGTAEDNANDHQEKETKTDVCGVRRSSQESSTTTTNTTTETSSTSNSTSSSDNSSSSEDSSESSSSSDESKSCESDSEDPDQSTDTVINKENLKTSGVSSKQLSVIKKDTPPDIKYDHHELVQKCLFALEECVVRFPQHYKSLYRLTHYYFRSKFHRNVPKCRDLLLGTYKCVKPALDQSESSFQGLFAERKNSNFFNNVWRIPSCEVDRPGSFASHMSRCVLLLMDVLRELKDVKMLLELCLQLRKTPDADKKYLRDSEREQLSRHALSLTMQILRSKLADPSAEVLQEIYKAYLRVQKHLPHKESTFSTLLVDAYKKHRKTSNGTVDEAVKFCQQESMPVLPPVSTMSPVTSGTTVVTTVAVTSVTVQPITSRKTTVQSTTKHHSTVTTPRPRGRPPNVPRTAPAPPPQPRLPYFPLHSIFPDASMLTSAVQSKIPPILDPNMAAFNMMMGTYQAELMRQLAAVNPINPMSSLLPPTSNISITPISSASQTSKSNSSKTTTAPTYPKLTSTQRNKQPLSSPYLGLKEQKEVLSSFKTKVSEHVFSTKTSSSDSRSIAKPVTKMMNYQNVPTSSISNIDVPSSMYKTSSNKTASNQKKSPFKNLPITNKGPSLPLPRGDPKEFLYQNLNMVSSTQSSQNQLPPSALHNIGREITVTSKPTGSHTSAVKAQVSSRLEIVPNPLPPSLDLPVNIPSSITITPRQPIPERTSAIMHTSGELSPKTVKDSISITEVKSPRKIPNVAMVIKNSDPIRKTDNDKPSGGGSVEIITLE